MLFLPKIVEAAEASPSAAAAAAKQIRKTLRDQWTAAYRQYHAMMLFRIFIDNPGSCKNIAKNVDGKFRDAVQALLRNHRDPSVQQITRETLEHFAQEKTDVTDLKPLVDMWLKEKAGTSVGSKRQSRAPGHVQQQQQQQQQQWQAWEGASQAGQGSLSHGNRRKSRHNLPSQPELAGRIEEARTSAKLLIQLTQSTPPAEFNSNELIREFADRCQSAQRSLQGYMNSDSLPDEETFQTLIETCEQLSLASSKHQRAALNARKATKESLQRADNLYSDVSRDISPSGAAIRPSQPPKAAPTPPSQLNTLAPIAKHIEQRANGKEKLSGPFNPFGDENQSFYPTEAPARRHSSRVSPPTPSAPFAELPTVSTPPADSSSSAPKLSNGNVPALSRKPVPTSTGTAEGYRDTAPPDSEQRRPLTSDSDDLYSAGDTPREATFSQSHAFGADTNKEVVATHNQPNGADASVLPNRGKERIKDDEPFSPVGGVSGSGWNY